MFLFWISYVGHNYFYPPPPLKSYWTTADKSIIFFSLCEKRKKGAKTAKGGKKRGQKNTAKGSKIKKRGANRFAVKKETLKAFKNKCL